MQFIDLAAQQQRIREKIEANIRKVLDHGKYIMGPEIGELERRLADYVGVSHAVSCSSGTDALLMALMAHNVGPGDAIITSPFTFIATAEVVQLLGATTVFVDIDPVTFNLNPEAIEKVITALKSGDTVLHPLPGNAGGLTPKGIVGVDIFGLPAEYDRINAIAAKHGLFVVEDAAQSFGAEAGGTKACALAEIGCTSFFPAKPLGAYGDGGAVFTNDDGAADRLRSIRIHGKGTDKYDNVRLGINGRLDALQAAILLAKMDIFPEEVELRQKAAERYTSRLKDCAEIVPPSVPNGMKSVWAQYSVLARDEGHRTALQAKLKEAGVPTAVYYPKPLHLQTAFTGLGYKAGDFPVSEDFSHRIFSLPMHPYLAEADQERIVDLMSA